MGPEKGWHHHNHQSFNINMLASTWPSQQYYFLFCTKTGWVNKLSIVRLILWITLTVRFTWIALAIVHRTLEKKIDDVSSNILCYFCCCKIGTIKLIFRWKLDNISTFKILLSSLELELPPSCAGREIGWKFGQACVISTGCPKLHPCTWLFRGRQLWNQISMAL